MAGSQVSNFVENVRTMMEIDPAAGKEMIRHHLEQNKNLPLKIAVTGQSGSGKSSFINALRGLDENDDGAAPTGVTETTIEVKSYPHPHFTNVTLWDLPGVGTPNFPAQNYLELVEFERFDFFVIVSAGRFTENDVNLAKEIKRLEKKFYFVRSKIDQDLQNERRKKNYCEEKATEKIRRACTEGLQSQELGSPRVFLLSSFDLSSYDFPQLHQTLGKELPKHKADALLYVMPIYSLDIIQEKKKNFQDKIWWLAALSGGVAAVPLPGLSAGVDLVLITATVSTYICAFGLDIESLERLAAKRGTTLGYLMSVMKCPASGQQITSELIKALLTQVPKFVLANVAEEASKWIPIVGIPLSMVLSFQTSYEVLEYFLNLFAEDAERVYLGALSSL